MANYVKRLRACLAPLLLIYTVSVTYFLAQTAWGNAPEEGVSNRKHPAVIDVLVQEERRHLRSFQDIVQSNRDSNPPSYIGGRTRRNLHFQVTNASVMDQVLILDEMGTDGVREDTDSVRHTGDVTVASNGGQIGKSDRNLGQNSDSQKQTFSDTKQTFKVEVEQWDHREEHGGRGHVVNNKPIPKPAPSLPKWPAQQKIGPRHAEVKYSIEYCDSIFKDLGTTSNICERKLATEGSDLHIPPSKTSLSFSLLGDIYIFSSFLDTRVNPPLVRLITIGVQGRDLTKSYYWCVFDISIRGSNDTYPGRLTHTDTATQLEYWAASDGHKRPAQFYIMSCPVPDHALPSFFSRHQGTIRVVIGDQHSPLLKPGQVGVTVPVVNNMAGSARPRGGNSPGNKREYFQKMEQDLQLLTNVIQADNNDDEDVSVDNKNNVDNNINNSNKLFFFQTPNVEQPDADVNNNNVNIITEPEVENSESFLDISDYKIVACVAPLQGNIGVIQLIEFIELQLLLGNHHIVFYAFQNTEEISSILRMYERRGLATVLAWKVPSPGSIWANGRDVALNDCLYRTMHLFHYAIFLDIDEFFVPRATPDMPSFLRYLKAVHHFNASRISDLVFSSAYFPAPTKQEYKNVSQAPDFTKDVNRMASLKSVFRSYHNQQHTLRMLRGEKAFRVGPGERRKSSFNISPRYAAVHHYSFCPRAPADPGSKTQAGLNVNKTINDNKDSVNILTLNQNPGESRQQVPREHKAAVSGDLKGHVLVTSSPASTAPVDMCLHKKVDWIMWRYKPKLIERTKESIRRLNKGSG